MERVGRKSQASGGKITVGCKLPNGLILRLFRMSDRVENVAGGGTRTFKIAEQVADHVVIKGNKLPFGEAPEYQIIGNYALTIGVDADFFAEWMKQNADHEAVKQGLIFAATNQSDAIDIAKDNRERKSGLEPIVPAEHGVKGKPGPVRGVTTSDLAKVA